MDVIQQLLRIANAVTALEDDDLEGLTKAQKRKLTKLWDAAREAEGRASDLRDDKYKAQFAYWGSEEGSEAEQRLKKDYEKAEREWQAAVKKHEKAEADLEAYEDTLPPVP